MKSTLRAVGSGWARGILWLAAPLVCLAGGGCADSSRPVFVDEDVVQANSAWRQADRLATPPPRIGSVHRVTLAFRSTPVESLADGPVAEATERALRVVEANRTAAVRERHAQLFASYRSEIQAQRPQRLEAMHAMLREQAVVADARISAALQDLASARGPVLARLAFLVGFPAAAPSAWPVPPPTDLWRLRFREEAKRLYVKLESEEADFRVLADRLREELSDMRQRLQGELNAEFARKLVEADERAIAGARAAFAADIGAEKSLLTERPAELHVPVREVRAEIPGWEPPPSQTEAAFGLDDLGAAHRLSIEIQTWAAQRGYRLVRRRAEGRDATEEFLRWKRTRHPGP